MMSAGDAHLGQRLSGLDVPESAVALCWLGQSGYVLVTNRESALIDPYLSNRAEEEIGVRRRVDPPITTETFVPDAILISHSDLDHLDLPTIGAYARAAKSHLLGPHTTVTRARARAGWALDASTGLKPGETCRVGSIEVAASFARHSDADLLTQDSIGFVIRAGGLVIWHAGDTEYDSRLRVVDDQTIDVALLPINGTGGNMNAHEAALLAWQMCVRAVVPMHYGMWADEDYTYRGLEPAATLDPDIFVDTYSRLRGTGLVVVLEPGEIWLFSRQSDSAALRAERVGSGGVQHSSRDK